MPPRAAAGDAPRTRWRPIRIARRRHAVVISVVPISEPFVHVFRDVVQSETVRRAPATSLRPHPPQFGVTKLGVRRLIAPGIKFPIQTAARRALPFGLGWQTIRFPGALAEPLAVSRGVEPAHASHRFIVPFTERVGARVAEARRGLSPRLFQEDAVEPVGHGQSPKGEAIHPDAPRRAFVRRARLTSHPKLACWNHDQYRLEVHRHSFISFRATAYTTFVSTSCIREFCTDVRFTWRIRSRASGSSCSIVPRYPEPKTSVHQSSGAESGWRPLSATTYALSTSAALSIAS